MFQFPFQLSIEQAFYLYTQEKKKNKKVDGKRKKLFIKYIHSHGEAKENLRNKLVLLPEPDRTLEYFIKGQIEGIIISHCSL